MAKPLLVTTPSPTSKEHPVLIIDQKGDIGTLLVEALKFSYLPVLVSRKKPVEKVGIVHIPYHQSFPRLPNNIFSHIVVVYNKGLDKHLTALLQRSARTKARLIFLVSIHEASQKLVEKVNKNPHAATILYGDLFGYHHITSPVQDLLRQATRHTVVLRNMGLSHVYPTYLSELISSILSVMYGIHAASLFVAADAPRTELSFVRLLQKIEPLIKMDFSREKGKSSTQYLPKEAENVYSQELSLETHLRQLFQTGEKEEPLTKEQKKPESRSIGKAILLGIFFLMILPFLTVVFTSIVGFGSMGFSALFFEKGNSVLSRDMARVSLQSFRLGSSSEQLITSLSDSTGLRIPSIHFLPSVASGMTVSELLLNLSAAAVDIEARISRGGPTSSEELRLSLKKIVITLQNLQAHEIFPLSYREKLARDERMISLITNMLEGSDSFLGIEKKKTYAVLFQNNMELRSGGGFIGSFALVDIEKGEMTDFQLLDVYDADGQLKGHIDPAFPLGRYMGAAHQFLRDSNLSLNTSVNATTAAEFIKLETGKTIDGVITMDLSFFKMLLSVTGPLYIPDYKVTITEDNMFREMQSRVEDNFFPGSTQKKDFLRSLTTVLLNKVKEQSFSPLLLGRVVTDAVFQKHLLVSSMDTNLQPLLVRNHFVSTPSLLPKGDVIGVVENNLGGNKANYYLKRRIVHTVALTEDKVASSSVTILYNNTSNGDKFGGDYKAYMQLVLPEDATLLSIAINGTPQQLILAITDPTQYTKSTFKAPKGFEIEEQQVEKVKAYGMYLTVKEQEQRIVSIVYTTKQGIGEDGMYRLSYFKQPGVDEDNYSLELLYPSSFVLQASPKNAVRRDRKVFVRESIHEDKTMEFGFIKR